jgi:hypothetical protein
VLKITRIVCAKANDFRHHVTRNVTPFTLAKDPDRRVLALHPRASLEKSARRGGIR